MQQETAIPSAIAATHHPLTEVIDIGDTVLQLERITQDRLAGIHTAQIAQLGHLLDTVAGHIKFAKGEILRTYTARYADLAKAQLLSLGRDSGTTHVMDGELDIAVEIDKTVKWDQTKLPVIWERIAASGEDPRQYIDIKYSVNETKYKAWPDTLKQPFSAARTVTPGNPKFEVRRAGEGK